MVYVGGEKIMVGVATGTVSAMVLLAKEGRNIFVIVIVLRLHITFPCCFLVRNY